MTDDLVAELDAWLSELDRPASLYLPPSRFTLLQRARDEIVALYEALDESVKLQRHYALLLNDYDGGGRIPFESGKAWMDRLRALKDKGP